MLDLFRTPKPVDNHRASRTEPGYGAISAKLRRLPAPEGLDAFQESLKARTKPLLEPPGRGHVIAVLGVPCNMDGTPTPQLQARINRAVQEAQKDPNAVIVSSGAAVQGQRSTEGDAIRRGLEAEGVAPERIWVDENARITVDNAAYIAALLPRIESSTGRSIKKMTVVAEPFHGPRAVRLFGLVPQFTTMELKFAPTERLPLHPLQIPKYVFPTRGETKVLNKGIINSHGLALLKRNVDEKRKMGLGF